jgi:hypothetical protein
VAVPPDAAALADLERQVGLRVRALPRGWLKKNRPAGKEEDINGASLFPAISRFFPRGLTS